MSTFMSGLRGKLMGVCGGLLLLMAAGVGHANSVTYIYTDPQGTPLAEADVNGNITATFDYAPYGSIALGTAPNGPGYTGHVNDPDTQLLYMQARYYDPAVGRFLSVDPVGPAPGNSFNFNRFAYANNNPIVYTDPNGKQTEGEAEPEESNYDAFGNATKLGENWASASAFQKMAGESNSGFGARQATEFLRMDQTPEKNAQDDARLDRLIAAQGTLQRNGAQGKAGEDATRAKYGDQIAGEKVTFKTSDGTRAVPDFVTKDNGIVETKTGGAFLSKGQSKLFDDISAGRPVTPVGKNADNAGLQSGVSVILKSATVDRQ
jgi:RHS repeat-associated protein